MRPPGAPIEAVLDFGQGLVAAAPRRYNEQPSTLEQLLTAPQEASRLLEELSADEHELLARIAHRSYIDGRTQEQIAREFGLSRPKVQRLLERARGTGVVDIHIVAPSGLNLDLEGQLVDMFDLTEAIVSPSSPDPDGAARGGRQERGVVPRAPTRRRHGRRGGPRP